VLQQHATVCRTALQKLLRTTHCLHANTALHCAPLYYYIKTAKTTSNPKVRAGEQVEGASGVVGYINNGDWVRYTVNIQQAGTYAVQYLLAGNPPAPNAQSIYMTLDLAGCAGPQLAPYTTATFSTGVCTVVVYCCACTAHSRHCAVVQRRM
jgi:hypothetical protein